MQKNWFDNAVFYSLDIETFCDSNADGIGDLQGLISKLEYIAGLGAGCIWLLPFFPSPNRDNGYDVMDYYNVDTKLGDLGDFAEFLEKARQLGLRVIIDLVVNHSSIQHPWFQAARKDKNSVYRNYYIWSDKPLEYEKEHLMLGGEEDTLWTYDEVAGQYYLHRFYKEQPDLNIGNPEVKKEILKIMGFWLALGVNGFRIDAAQMLVEDYGMKGPDKDDLLAFINQMRDFAQSRKKDVLLLAEVNSEPEEMKIFLQEEERMHLLFNFYINQHLFLSLAREDKTPLEESLLKLKNIHPHNHWLHFLRHHDELNVKLLDKKAQASVLDRFAPQEDMRIYGFGIRRRLASMMDGSDMKLKMAYSLLFSLPGAHLIRYGDEIGMGDDLSLPGRTSVRTPMQWSPARNGGFSQAPDHMLVHPVISDGNFGYHKINVMSAQQRPGSLLNWIERLITTRKQCPEIGNGTLFMVPYPGNEILIHGLELEEEKLLFIHNFSQEPQELSIADLIDQKSSLFEIFGEDDKDINSTMIILEGYDYKWFREVKNTAL